VLRALRILRLLRVVSVAPSLRRVAEGLILEVSDDGCGFDPAAIRHAGAAGGLGLAYMRERIELLGGRLTLASAPGQGCLLQAEFPSV
jgi:signal transduction histidine kinase